MIVKASWVEDITFPLGDVPARCLIHVPGIGTGIKTGESSMVLLYTTDGKPAADVRLLDPETRVKILPRWSRITIIQE